MVQFLQASFLQNQWGFLFSALVIGFAGAGLIAKWGKKFFLVDMPVARSSHNKIIPKGGGVGIVLAAFAYALYNTRFNWLIPIVVLAIFSLLGDRKEITFQWRLLVQFAAIFTCLTLISVQAKPPLISSFSLVWIFFILFASGTANFFNFMDGIDGIAAITAIVAFFALSYFAFFELQYDQYWVAFCLFMVFAIFGFLPWNFFSSAKVFMGDVGSIFLGTLLACMIVYMSQNWVDFFMLCSVLFPFYADCLLTLVAKKARKIPLNQPHRIHLYQILANEAKLGHVRVTLFYAVFQIIFILLVFSFVKNAKDLILWLFGIFGFILLLYLYLRKKIIHRFF